MEKPYALGILVGRFQNLHLGHEEMIRKALALCDAAAVFIGSSQEAGTEKNPYSYALRAELLHSVFGEDLKVFPLPDIGVGNNARWGEYVLVNVQKRMGKFPDLLVTGKEERRTGWFDGIQGAQIAELIIPKRIEISATEIRSFLLTGDRASWEKYTPRALHSRYELLRAAVLSAQNHKETASL